MSHIESDFEERACEAIASAHDHGDWKATRTANGYPESARSLLAAGWRPICRAHLGSKTCVLMEGHGGGMHYSNSGTMWPAGKDRNG